MVIWETNFYLISIRDNESIISFNIKILTFYIIQCHSRYTVQMHLFDMHEKRDKVI